MQGLFCPGCKSLLAPGSKRCLRCGMSADGLMTIGQYLYPTLLGEPYEGYIDEYFSGSGDEPSGGNDTPSTDGGVSNADVSEWLFIFAGVVALVGSIAGLAMVGRDKH